MDREGNLMKRQQWPQRLLAWVLACVMVFTCVPQALADDSAEAATMQLQKTEGTVDISTSTGKSVPTRNSLRLYNGYCLETDEESYAWINLDKSKLVKEDAVSEISIRKSGKKLEILVDSGNLFFNVSEPLEDDESMNIHTSTMVVGVRGTCGWVDVIDKWNSQVYILEGAVEVSVTDPVTGETKTDTVRGGETATCVVYSQERPGSKCDILRNTFKEKDVDGFVLAELVQDRPMCQKIYDDSGLDLRRPNLRPRDRLKQDQGEVRKELEQIEEQVQEQDSGVTPVPVWPDLPDGMTPPSTPATKTPTQPPSPSIAGDDDDDDDDDDSGSGGGWTPEPDPAPTDTVTLTMPQSAATVNGWLARETVRHVILVPGTVRLFSARASTASLLDVDSALTVPSGKTLTLQTGVGLDAPDGSLLTVRGTLTAGGRFYLGSDLGSASQYGSIKATSFTLADAVASWKVSSAADSRGYYTLTYSPQTSRTYTITFNPNGGTVTPTAAAAVDGILTSLPTPTRDGYTFDGWYTAASGGAAVTDGHVFTGDTTIYAHWTVIPVVIPPDNPPEVYTVTFDPNGGTVTPTTATTDENGFIDLPTPTRAGENYTSGATQVEKRYVFDGWYSDREYGYQIEADGIYADMTVYAHWLIELNISGNGAMADYTYSTSGGPDGSSDVPWFDERQLVLKVTIEDGVTSIGNYAFNYCNHLTTITVPDSVTSIGQAAFQFCRNLTNVNIPYGVKVINNGAFNDCDKLSNITIPNSVTSIGSNAFRDCGNLTSITIPNSVISIGWSAFAGSGLTSVTVPGSVTSMQYSIFAGCLDMSSAIISDGITAIADSMFASCRNLTSITISDSVTSIGDEAFWQCNSLTSITIPSSVTSMGYGVFDECTVLTDTYFGGTEEQWNAITGITNAGIPDTATIHYNYDPDTASEVYGAAVAAAASAINVMCSPVGIAGDADGSLLVTDIYGKLLWRVQTRVGTVYAGGETVQDLYGQPIGGYHDDALTASHFRGPWAVAPFLGGWAVSDSENNVVRFIRDDATKTLKGSTKEPLKVTSLGVVFNRPTGLAVDEGGNLYVADTGNGAIRKLTPTGDVTTVAKDLSEPMGLCWRNGVLYIAEAGKNRIVTLARGNVSVLAGNSKDGLANGKAMNASFSAPQGLTVGRDGSVYVADTGNGAVRRIRNGVVTTLAAEGLMTPKGLLLQDRKLYVCDSFVRKIFVFDL